MDPPEERDPELDQPTLVTPRLVLRPYQQEDSDGLARLAGERAIADTTISIPHPYTTATARARISDWQIDAENRSAYHFAVCRAAAEGLIGGVELRAIDWEHLQGELSLWIGVTQQGRGYAGEALGELIGYGFEQLGLWRLYAYHMVRNPASGRVLERVGMRREGVMRDRVCKWGRFEDVVMSAILRSEWHR